MSYYFLNDKSISKLKEYVRKGTYSVVPGSSDDNDTGGGKVEG